MSVRVNALLAVLPMLAFAAPALAQEQSATTQENAVARARMPLADIPGVATSATAPETEPTDGDDEAENRALVENARTTLEDGKNQEAAQMLLEAIRTAKHERAEPRRLLAIALERLGALDPALRYAEAAAAIHPQGADVQSLVGGILMKLGRAAEAQPHLRSATLAVAAEPDNPNVTYAWFALGECLQRGGYALAAAEAYQNFDESVFDSHPEHANAERVKAILAENPRGGLFRRVELLKQLSRDDDLDRLTRAAVDRWSDDPTVARARAAALLDIGRADEALAFARARLDDRASQTLFLPVAVDAAARAGALKDWLGEIENAIQDGQTPSFAVEMVRLLNRSGKGEEAAQLGLAIVKGGGPRELLWQVAIGEVLAGRMGEGTDVLAGLVRDLPPGRDLPDSRIREWCEAVAGTGNVAAKVGELRQREPRDYATDFVLGVTAAGVDEPALAEALFAACLKAKPDFAPALSARGRMLLADYQWEAAKAEAKSLLKSQPEQAAAWLILAEAHDGLDENEEADEAYRKAIRFAPDEPLYRLALARHHRRLDEQLGAQRYYAETLDLDPLCGEAYEGLIESYIRDGKFALAKEHWRDMQTRSIPDDVLRRVGTTIRFYEAGKLFTPDHVAEMARQFSDHPTDVVLARYYSATLAALEKVDDARAVCDQALAHAPEDFQLLLVRAEVLSADIQFDAAAHVLEALVKRYPNRVVVLRRLALAYRYDFRTSEARAILTRLADRPGESANNADVSMLYQSYMEFGEFDEANRIIESLMQKFPDDRLLVAKKLDNLVAAKKKDEAFEIVSKRLATAPDDEAERELFFRTAQSVERYAEAEAKVREWMKEDVDGVYAEKLIDVLLEAKKFDAAMEAAKSFPDTSWPLALRRRLLMARVERASGKLAEAVSEFDGIVESRGIGTEQQLAIQRETLLALCDDRQFDAALDRCDKWLKDVGGTPQARMVYLRFKSFVYQLAGREEEYLDNLETLWRLDPADPTMNNDLGYAWVDAGRNLDRAIPMIRKAVSAEPMVHAYLDSLGWAYYKSGDFANAKKYLDRASRLFTGHDPDVLDHLGDAEWRLGEKDAAAGHWREARKLLEEAPDAEKLPPDQVKLLASIRAKLSALANQQPPPIATVVEPGGGANR